MLTTGNQANRLEDRPQGLLAASSPAPQAIRSGPDTRHASLHLLVAALATAGLLWLCYFPVSCGWLAWVALVPLLCLVRTTLPARRVYLFAWLSGLAFFWPALEWLRVADARMYATWAALATYCSLYFPLGIFLVRRLDQRTRLPLVLTVPVVWTALEFLRAHLLTGFAWYYLAHTQHALLPLIQVADLAGAYAVTFLVAAVNALAFELLCTTRWFRVVFLLREPAARPWSVLPLQAAAVFLVLGATIAYGAWRLNQETFTDGPRVALIQGNLDQEIRNDASSDDADEAFRQVVRHYVTLSYLAAAQQPKPQLIVWPETSYPDDWLALTPDFQRERLRPGALEKFNGDAQAYACGWGTNVLLGLNTQEWGAGEHPRRYNSALLLRGDGREAGRYDKIHRVPFGEYVPLRDWLPFMNRFAPYDFDYSIRPGEHLTRFPLPTAQGDYSFGVIICFEDTDPDLARQYARPGADGGPADFLLNISNDGWFKGTREHEEHLAICRFRAVECRRAVARAVNMGISAVIDGSGRVVALPGPSLRQSKKFAAVMTAIIPIDHRESLYARWGDWLAWGCWLVVAVGLVLGLARVRTSSDGNG
jgi:apolipoprotein N-acyltransferase